MTEKMHERVPQAMGRHGERRCPSCAAVLEKHWQLLDTRSGRMVHVYQYRCGECVWED